MRAFEQASKQQEGGTKRRNSLDSVASLQSKDERKEKLNSSSSKNNNGNICRNSHGKSAALTVEKPGKEKQVESISSDKPATTTEETSCEQQPDYADESDNDNEAHTQSHGNGAVCQQQSYSISSSKCSGKKETVAAATESPSSSSKPASILKTATKRRFGTPESPELNPSSLLPRDRLRVLAQAGKQQNEGGVKRRNSLDSVASLQSKEERKECLSSSGKKIDKNDENDAKEKKTGRKSETVSNSCRLPHPENGNDSTAPYAESAPKKYASSLADRIACFNAQPGPPKRRNSLDSVASLKSEDKRKLPDVVRLSLKSKKRSSSSKMQEAKPSSEQQKSTKDSSSQKSQAAPTELDTADAEISRLSLETECDVPRFVPKKITSLLMDRIRLFEQGDSSTKGELSGWDWLGAQTAVKPGQVKRRNSLDSVASLHSRKHELIHTDATPPSSSSQQEPAGQSDTDSVKPHKDKDSPNDESENSDGDATFAEEANCFGIDTNLGSGPMIRPKRRNSTESVGPFHHHKEHRIPHSSKAKENKGDDSSSRNASNSKSATTRDDVKHDSKQRVKPKRRNSLDSVASLHDKSERSKSLVRVVKNGKSVHTIAKEMLKNAKAERLNADKESSTSKKKIKVRVKVRVKGLKKEDAEEQRKHENSARSKPKRRNSLDSVASLHSRKNEEDETATATPQSTNTIGADWKALLQKAVAKKSAPTKSKGKAAYTTPTKKERRNSLDSVASLHERKLDGDTKATRRKSNVNDEPSTPTSNKDTLKKAKEKTNSAKEPSDDVTLLTRTLTDRLPKGGRSVTRSNSFDTIESARKKEKEKEQVHESHHRQVLVGHRPGGFLGGFEALPEMSRRGVYRSFSKSEDRRAERPDDWLGGPSQSPRRQRKKPVSLPTVDPSDDVTLQNRYVVVIPCASSKFAFVGSHRIQCFFLIFSAPMASVQ
jgi:hypothetical protein